MYLFNSEKPHQGWVNKICMYVCMYVSSKENWKDLAYHG